MIFDDVQVFFRLDDMLNTNFFHELSHLHTLGSLPIMGRKNAALVRQCVKDYYFSYIRGTTKNLINAMAMDCDINHFSDQSDRDEAEKIKSLETLVATLTQSMVEVTIYAVEEASLQRYIDDAYRNKLFKDLRKALDDITLNRLNFERREKNEARLLKLPEEGRRKIDWRTSHFRQNVYDLDTILKEMDDAEGEEASIPESQEDSSIPQELPKATEDEGIGKKESEETSKDKPSETPKEEAEESEEEAQDSENFQMQERCPENHSYYNSTAVPLSKVFTKGVRNDINLMRKNLPKEIVVKGFEDRMDLYTAMIVGPKGTPYEDALFFFDIQLPDQYPNVRNHSTAK